VVIHLDTTFLEDVIRESRRDEQGPARRWLTRNPHETLGISVFVLCELQMPNWPEPTLESTPS